MITLAGLQNYIKNAIEDKRPPQPVLEKYREVIGANDSCSKLTDELARATFHNSIIFLSDRPNYFFLRVSLALKKYGIPTVLITRWGVEKEQKEFFDHIFIYDKFSELECLNDAKGCTIYVQSWVGWNFLPVYISLMTTSNIVCNVNDVSHLLFDQHDDLSRLGFSKEDINIDISCEKYIFDNFPLVTVPYKAGATDALYESDKVINNVITFPCYPCPEFFDNSERHLTTPGHIFYGGMIPFDEKPDRVFGDAKMHNVVADILNDRVSVSLYYLPQIGLSNFDLGNKYKFFSSKSLVDNRFVFKQGYPPWVLKNHSKDFNYGFIVYYYEDDFLISRKHYQNFIPTKLFTYIEMGLPIIVIEDLVAAAELVKKNEIGIVVSRNDVSRMSDVLSCFEASYDQFVENVQKYRRNNNMDVMLDGSKLLTALRPGG